MCCIHRVPGQCPFMPAPPSVASVVQDLQPDGCGIATRVTAEYLPDPELSYPCTGWQVVPLHDLLDGFSIVAMFWMKAIDSPGCNRIILLQLIQVMTVTRLCIQW